MSRPPLEVADLVRAAGTASSSAAVSGSAGPISRSCWPLRIVAPPLWAAISMNVAAVDIVPPSPTTAALWGVFSNGEYCAGTCSERAFPTELGESRLTISVGALLR